MVMNNHGDEVRNIIRGPEARIALCKCKESKKIYGVRFEREGTGWKYTWAFPVKEDTARREGYESTILTGDLQIDNNYNGCPYCGAKYFVVCSNCQKLNCNIGDPTRFKCEWCGATGELQDYDGAGIASGGDR